MAAVFLLTFFSGCRRDAAQDDRNVNKLEDGNLIVRENLNEINISVSSFDTFNPIMTKSPSVAEFMKTVCEPLFEYDEACNPIPLLAQNYALSSDGLTVSFDVKPVQFHDSSALSASDVIYTINMIKNNDTLYDDCVKYIKDAFSDENGRVYIRLRKPVVNFAGMLNFPVVKNKTPAEVSPDYIPVGTGPCKYNGKKNANQVAFCANAEWHGGEPGFKNIIVNVLKDSTVMLHSFDAGETDVAASVFAGGGEIAPRGEYNVNEYTSNALTFLGINNTLQKFSGKYTRKAIELLCDKEKIVRVEMYSKAEKVKFPINPSAWFYPETAEETRDYETINANLAKDGWTKTEDGYYRDAGGRALSVKILVNKDNDEKVRIADNIADGLNEFGIAATLRSMDFERYKAAVREKDYDLFVGEIIMDSSMDPSMFTAPGDNYFGYSGTAGGALDGAAKTADQSVIKAKLAEYAAAFSDEIPFVPLFFKKERVVYNKYLSGVLPPNMYGIYRGIDKWYISKTK